MMHIEGRTLPPTCAECPPLHSTQHAMNERSKRAGRRRPRPGTGRPRPGAGGQQRQDLQQPGRKSDLRDFFSVVRWPHFDEISKTSYSSREFLSGALMEYSFVHASANSNDDLPRGLNPCSPCPHSTNRPLSAPDRAPRAPSLRLLSPFL